MNYKFIRKRASKSLVSKNGNGCYSRTKGRYLFLTSLYKIPYLAKVYASKFCRETSWTPENVIKAYAHYAQLVEKLPCEDEEFKVTAADVERFEHLTDEDF